MSATIISPEEADLSIITELQRSDIKSNFHSNFSFQEDPISFVICCF